MRSGEWFWRAEFFVKPGSALHDFRAALGVLDFHPEENLDDQMKYPAGKFAHTTLLLLEHGAGQPARADDAVRFTQALHQIMKRARGRGAVGVHVADDVG